MATNARKPVDCNISSPSMINYRWPPLGGCWPWRIAVYLYLYIDLTDAIESALEILHCLLRLLNVSCNDWRAMTRLLAPSMSTYDVTPLGVVVQYHIPSTMSMKTRHHSCDGGRYWIKYYRLTILLSLSLFISHAQPANE